MKDILSSPNMKDCSYIAFIIQLKNSSMIVFNIFFNIITFFLYPSHRKDHRNITNKILLYKNSFDSIYDFKNKVYRFPPYI